MGALTSVFLLGYLSYSLLGFFSLERAGLLLGLETAGGLGFIGAGLDATGGFDYFFMGSGS